MRFRVDSVGWWGRVQWVRALRYGMRLGIRVWGWPFEGGMTHPLRFKTDY